MKQSSQQRPTPMEAKNPLKQSPNAEALALQECEKIEQAAVDETESRDDAVRLLSDSSWIQNKLQELSVPEKLHKTVKSDLAALVEKYHDS